MTLEEAKKILEKEGFAVDRFIDVKAYDIKVPSWEKVEVGEAMKVVVGNDYMPLMHVSKYKEREARLKEEYGKYHIKGDFSGNKSIEHCGEPIPGSPLSAVEGIKLKWKDNRNTSEKTALKESASQFNDALLDEQAKKIAELTKDKELMKKASLSQLDDFIEIYNLLTKESQKVKRLGKEIAKLNGIIHDKNAILADVAEELRLSKIREKNLTEVGQKYMKENEELKNNLADKIVVKIDAQALKSAESALAYKEKVIAEKDEVIADLTHELKAKHKKYVWYKGAYDAAQQILNTIADYAAKHPDKKFSDPMVEENHPTIDNPEEIEIEKAVKLVRKAMKEGHTVTIDYKD